METRSKKRPYSEIGSTKLYENIQGTIGDCYLPPNGGTLMTTPKVQSATAIDPLVGLNTNGYLETFKNVSGSNSQLQVGQASTNYGAEPQPFATVYQATPDSVTPYYYFTGPSKSDNGTKFNLLGWNTNKNQTETYSGKVTFDTATNKLNLVGAGAGLQVNGTNIGVPNGDISVTSITSTTPGVSVVVHDSFTFDSGKNVTVPTVNATNVNATTALSTPSIGNGGSTVSVTDSTTLSSGKTLTVDNVTSNSAMVIKPTGTNNITIKAQGTSQSNGIFNLGDSTNPFYGSAFRINIKSDNTTGVCFVPEGDMTKPALCNGVYKDGSTYRPYIGAQIPNVSWADLTLNPGGNVVIAPNGPWQPVNQRVSIQDKTDFLDNIYMHNTQIIDTSRNFYGYGLYLNPSGPTGLVTTAPLNANRTYTMPDKSGTVAMLSDVVSTGGRFSLEIDATILPTPSIDFAYPGLTTDWTISKSGTGVYTLSGTNSSAKFACVQCTHANISQWGFFTVSQYNPSVPNQVTIKSYDTSNAPQDTVIAITFLYQ